MNEELNLKLSLYIDNELEANEVTAFKKELLQNPELQAGLKRYQLIGRAIKYSPTIVTNASFLESIKDQLEQEPSYFLPQHKTKQKHFKQLAVVASFLTVAIISAYSVKFIQLSPKESVGLQVAQKPVPKTSVEKSPQIASTTFEQPLNKQINDYLKAHNESLKANPDSVYQPYTRLSAYDQR